MKLIDCFLYHNEDLVLDIRLNTLNEHVNKFVIVESKFDHQGNKKGLNFDFKKFKKFENKINYQVIEEFPEDISNWDRENYQRNFIVNGLDEFNENDYIIISDVDEIPDLKKLRNLQNNKFTVFQQKMFYYKFNLLNSTEPIWYGSKICKKKHLKSPQWLRDQKVKNYPFWKFYKIKWNIIKDGGWHFSFLMDAKQIKSKLESYAHAEFNNKNFNTLEKINFSLKNQVDLFDRKIEFEKIVFDETFPKYILNNKEKYKNWIL